MAKTKFTDFNYGYKAKKYHLADGECIDCTLEFNCRENMGEIKRFLEANGIVCQEGKNVQVREE